MIGGFDTASVRLSMSNLGHASDHNYGSKVMICDMSRHEGIILILSIQADLRSGSEFPVAFVTTYATQVGTLLTILTCLDEIGGKRLVILFIQLYASYLKAGMF